MKKYEISVLGEKYYITSLQAGNFCQDEPSYILIPSIKYDFELLSTHQTAPSLGAVRAAAEYIYSVLGYPRCELDIEAFGKIYKLRNFEHGIVVILDKCKSKITKSNCEAAGVSLSLACVYAECKARFLKADDISFLDGTLLSAISLGEKDGGYSVILGYQLTDRGALLRLPPSNHLPIEFSLALFRLLSPVAEIEIEGRGKLRIESSSGELKLLIPASAV